MKTRPWEKNTGLSFGILKNASVQIIKVQKIKKVKKTQKVTNTEVVPWKEVFKQVLKFPTIRGDFDNKKFDENVGLWFYITLFML